MSACRRRWVSLNLQHPGSVNSAAAGFVFGPAQLADQPVEDHGARVGTADALRYCRRHVDGGEITRNRSGGCHAAVGLRNGAIVFASPSPACGDLSMFSGAGSPMVPGLHACGGG